MAIQNSPSVLTAEKDFTLGVRGVGTSTAAIAIQARWGAIEKPDIYADEDEVILKLATPDVNTVKDFKLATNFLSYSPNLYINRVAGDNTLNACNSGQAPVLIKNDDHFDTLESGLSGYSSIARYGGTLGNSIRVVVLGKAKQAKSSLGDELQYEHDADQYALFVIDADGKWSGLAGTILEQYENLTFTVGDKKNDGTLAYIKDVINQQSSYIYIPDETQAIFNGIDQTEAITVDTETVNVDGAISAVSVVTFPSFTDLSSTDSLKLTVGGSEVTDFTVTGINEITLGTAINADGVSVVLTRGVTEFTLGTTLDAHHSVASIEFEGTEVAFTIDGDDVTLTNAIYTEGTANINVVYDYTMQGGADDYTANYIAGYDPYEDEENYDIFAIISATQDVATVSSIFDIVETRKDCVLYYSPSQAAVVNNAGSEHTACVEYFTETVPRSSTYAFRTCNWKYQVDTYNNGFVWVPDCADAAGLQAQTQDEFDPWFIGAGYDNGRMKNVIKLAWNPSKRAYKDLLFKNAINPVFTEKGEGVLLMGDKTATLKPTAFDSIGIRLMFIYMKKSIKASAKYNLFKINDEFTRTAFVNSVDPFLEDIKGRRGIDAKKVVCDTSNNTPQVRQERKFIGDILVKPLYAIRFIQLNFVAVGATVSFEEIEGV